MLLLLRSRLSWLYLKLVKFTKEQYVPSCPYGCFVEIMPGKDGLLHISEIDWKRLETVERLVSKRAIRFRLNWWKSDPKTGKYKLSHRALLPKPEGYVERASSSWAWWASSRPWKRWTSSSVQISIMANSVILSTRISMIQWKTMSRRISMIL